MEALCRPQEALGEGRGIVRWYPSTVVLASDHYQWEINHFGAGYTVQMVSLRISFWITSCGM